MDSLLSEPAGKPLYIHIYVYTHICICTHIYMLYLYKHSNRYVMISHCGFSVHFLMNHNVECHFICLFVILIASFIDIWCWFSVIF